MRCGRHGRHRRRAGDVGPCGLRLDGRHATGARRQRGGARPAAEADWAAAAELAVSRLEPEPDIHATADYRAHLARVLTARAFHQAVNGGPQ
ncbi:MAG: hypothetical protein ACTHN8_03215 [Angustibacter sp.]